MTSPDSTPWPDVADGDPVPVLASLDDVVAVAPDLGRGVHPRGHVVHADLAVLGRSEV
jgi:hypothetical protein